MKQQPLPGPAPTVLVAPATSSATTVDMPIQWWFLVSLIVIAVIYGIIVTFFTKNKEVQA